MNIRKRTQHISRKAAKIRSRVTHIRLLGPSSIVSVRGASMKNIKLCSGFGATHTDKHKPLSTVVWDEITALVDCPQDVEKSKDRKSVV